MVMMVSVSTEFLDFILKQLFRVVIRLILDLFPDGLRGISLLFLGFLDWGEAVFSFKVADGLVTRLIELAVKHTHFHSYLRRRVILFNEFALLHDFNDDGTLLWQRLKHMTIEELVRLSHLHLVQPLELLNMRLQLQTLLLLHVLLFLQFPLLIHSLLFRVHISTTLDIIR